MSFEYASDQKQLNKLTCGHYTFLLLARQISNIQYLQTFESHNALVFNHGHPIILLNFDRYKIMVRLLMKYQSQKSHNGTTKLLSGH